MLHCYPSLQLKKELAETDSVYGTKKLFERIALLHMALY